MVYPKSCWLLFDESNSNENSKNYVWWFETKKLAVNFLDNHNRIFPDGARLTGR
jgi:hypothetical protein